MLARGLKLVVLRDARGTSVLHRHAVGVAVARLLAPSRAHVAGAQVDTHVASRGLVAVGVGAPARRSARSALLALPRHARCAAVVLRRDAAVVVVSALRPTRVVTVADACALGLTPGSPFAAPAVGAAVLVRPACRAARPVLRSYGHKEGSEQEKRFHVFFFSQIQRLSHTILLLPFNNTK